MPRAFADYYRTHFWLTTSGAFQDSALICSIAEMGLERILFAVDWPYIDNAAGVAWLKKAPISDSDRAAIFAGNAREAAEAVGGGAPASEEAPALLPVSSFSDQGLPSVRAAIGVVRVRLVLRRIRILLRILVFPGAAGVGVRWRAVGSAPGRRRRDFAPSGSRPGHSCRARRQAPALTSRSSSLQHSSAREVSSSSIPYVALWVSPDPGAFHPQLFLLDA